MKKFSRMRCSEYHSEEERCFQENFFIIIIITFTKKSIQSEKYLFYPGIEIV